MPGHVGGEFAESVTFIADHNASGAMGLVVNKLTELAVSDVLLQLDIEVNVACRKHVHWGGPVAPDRGFVLHRDEGNWESTLHIEGDIAITTSRDILEAIGNGFGPSHFLITLGYAGWGEGQLESELLRNSWLTAPADQRIIFESPINRRWADAARLLGLSIDQISGQSGHA